MKILGLELWRDWFLSKPSTKWLVVDTSKVKTYYGSLTSCEVCSAHECSSEAEARDYLENEVTKNHQKHCRIFMEVSLSEERLCPHGIPWKDSWKTCNKCMT